MQSSLLLCALLAQSVPTAKAAIPKPTPAPDRELVVEAGQFERQNTLVPIQLTTPEAAKRWLLRDGRGKRIPFDIDQQGKAWFLLDSLPVGRQAKFRLTEDTSATKLATTRVHVDTSDQARLRILLDGRQVLQFEGRLPLGTKEKPQILRGGYVNPVFTPAGVQVTEALPSDDPRQLGIWTFWKKFTLNGKTVDFWDRVGVSGTIQMESMGPTWNGDVDGGFEARIIYTGIEGFAGTTLLRDRWRVQVYAGPKGAKLPYYVFDLETEQAGAGQFSISIPKGEVGGVALRGRGDWAKEPGGPVRMISERDPQAKRVLWAYIGGVDKGRKAGIAMLGNPFDFGSPQELAKWPSPVVLNLIPTADSAVPIDPGRPLRQVYRFVALDGAPDRKLLSRMYNDFAFPPRVTIHEVGPAKAPAPKP